MYFYLWRRLEEEERGRLWRLYGRFSALMTFGSCFGAVAWGANMMLLAYGFKTIASRDIIDRSSLLSSAYNWAPLFFVAYAIEFMCVCAAQLMVLDRMSVFAKPQSPTLRAKWPVIKRLLMAAVVLGNAAGLAANAAAAVYVAHPFCIESL
jgi:hypothetical protein